MLFDEFSRDLMIFTKNKVSYLFIFSLLQFLYGAHEPAGYKGAVLVGGLGKGREGWNGGLRSQGKGFVLCMLMWSLLCTFQTPTIILYRDLIIYLT